MKHRGSKGKLADDRVEALRGLRELRGTTQVELSEILMISQGALSKLERRSDVRVSTLRAFVEALGGELVVSAKFRERSVTIELPFEPSPKSR